MKAKEFIREAHRRLHAAWGPQGWWPGRDEEDVIIGAVLTQNTSWRNVTRAMENLESAGLCRLPKIAKARRDRLARLLHPVGYFNIKAERLKSVAQWFVREWNCDWPRLRREPTESLREKMLSVKGIGPETADSILLYALGHTTFVVDAYTKRIFARHGITPADIAYHDLQALFHRHLEPDVPLFNDYHALLVRAGHHHCRRVPNCEECPLGERKLFTRGAWEAVQSNGRRTPRG